jgi:hypothetical protein
MNERSAIYGNRLAPSKAVESAQPLQTERQRTSRYNWYLNSRMNVNTLSTVGPQCHTRVIINAGLAVFDVCVVRLGVCAAKVIL